MKKSLLSIEIGQPNQAKCAKCGRPSAQCMCGKGGPQGPNRVKDKNPK